MTSNWYYFDFLFYLGHLSSLLLDSKDFLYNSYTTSKRRLRNVYKRPLEVCWSWFYVMNVVQWLIKCKSSLTRWLPRWSPATEDCFFDGAMVIISNHHILFLFLIFWSYFLLFCHTLRIMKLLLWPPLPRKILKYGVVANVWSYQHFLQRSHVEIGSFNTVNLG